MNMVFDYKREVLAKLKSRPMEALREMRDARARILAVSLCAAKAADGLISSMTLAPSAKTERELLRCCQRSCVRLNYVEEDVRIFCALCRKVAQIEAERLKRCLAGRKEGKR